MDGIGVEIRQDRAKTLFAAAGRARPDALAAACILAGLSLCAAADAPAGSPACRPSPGNPVGWRGDGTGVFPDATPPLVWNQTEVTNGVFARTNIAWCTLLPGESPSSPIVVGDRVFLGSGRAGLVCLDKRDGKVLWVRTVDLYDALTPEDRAADTNGLFAAIDPLQKRVEALCAQFPTNAPETVRIGGGRGSKLGGELSDLSRKIDKAIQKAMPGRFDPKNEAGEEGLTDSTPASDGAFVYVCNDYGVTACYDLDGNRRWVRYRKPGHFHHGIHSSPLLVGDKLVVCVGKMYQALDKATGREIWTSEKHAELADWNGIWYGSPVRFQIAGQDVFAAGDGSIVRVADGVRIVRTRMYGIACSSPVPCGDRLTTLALRGNVLQAVAIPATMPAAPYLAPFASVTYDNPKARGKHESDFWVLASPLWHQNLLYLVGNHEPKLYVFERSTNGAFQAVWEKPLDFGDDPVSIQARRYRDGTYCSPAVAGGKLFVTSPFGTTLILEPGRDYKELARNRIDRFQEAHYKPRCHEETCSNLFFDGPRIFYRSEGYLYCIEDSNGAGRPGR